MSLFMGSEDVKAEFDYMAKNGEFAKIAEEKNKNNIGDFLVVEVRDDSPQNGLVRVYIRSLDRAISYIHKYGWWETFTLMQCGDEALERGFYLAKVRKFQTDKNGYLNLIVDKVRRIGSTINEDDLAWDFFIEKRHTYCRFLDIYQRGFSGRWMNIPELKKLTSVVEKMRQMPDSDVEDAVLHLYIGDILSLEEIERILRLPSPFEMRRMEIEDNALYQKGDLYDLYPSLFKKLHKTVEREGISEVMGHMLSLAGTYLQLVEEGKLQRQDEEIDDLAQAQAVCLFYEKKKEEEKRLKKEAKKARKALK